MVSLSANPGACRLRAALFALLFALPPLAAQQLPTGTYHPNRERTLDLLHLRADLHIDWKARGIRGSAAITLRPLAGTNTVSLDAYRLNVRRVTDASTGAVLRYATDSVSIRIEPGRTLSVTDTVTFVIEYSATPSAGMYFIDPCPGTNNQPAIFTYGEGGIHANWLPLYNENNDKFSSEILATVSRPHTAISNGVLVRTVDHPDGSRTFHWHQALPHSHYLIALFVGDYRAVPLRPAFGTVPLTVWVHPGQEADAAEVFRRTPDMVEFFSDRFNFRYPWDKYDQIAAYDYAIGAMENTGVTGHNDRILRSGGQTPEFNPDFDAYASNWTAETLISHELAHHWFGNNTTCTNLANIWINESFASYLMMLWDEHRLGREDLQAATWLALQSYLKYVAESHTIRPLEYRFFDSRGQIYNLETTYQKGAIVLHMMRWILGDEAFFRSLAYFQGKHRFSNVESIDLKRAIEEAAGVNLDYFFDQWIWGGGHPVFEVHSVYVPGHRKVQVSLAQVQPLVEGQGVFRLPVKIRIDTGGKTATHIVWVDEAEETFFFDAPSAPDMVSVDGGGALVADIRHEQSLSELLYQVRHDEVPGRLRALGQMIARYAADPAVVAAIRSVLESDVHWIVKAEAVSQLRSVESPEAGQLLLDQAGASHVAVRKAAVIALGYRHTDAARKILRRIAEREPNDDIAATALVSLSRIDPALSPEWVRGFLDRSSWYDVKRLAALKALEIRAGHAGSFDAGQIAAWVRPYADMHHNYAIRQQALATWAVCTPNDTRLLDHLIQLAQRDILPVRLAAIDHLAALKVLRAVPALEEVARTNGDSDIRFAARKAIDSIRSIRTP